MTIDTFVALVVGLACLLAVGVVGGLSLWVVTSRRVREGPRPVPPWWWERKGWDD